MKLGDPETKWGGWGRESKFVEQVKIFKRVQGGSNRVGEEQFLFSSEIPLLQHSWNIILGKISEGKNIPLKYLRGRKQKQFQLESNNLLISHGHHSADGSCPQDFSKSLLQFATPPLPSKIQLSSNYKSGESKFQPAEKQLWRGTNEVLMVEFLELGLQSENGVQSGVNWNEINMSSQEAVR